MSYFNSEFKSMFMDIIVRTLYGEDRTTLALEQVVIFEKAAVAKGYSSGFFMIYYDGGYTTINLRTPIESKTNIIRFDLQKEYVDEMDNWSERNQELEFEIHNVKGLLRSVLNAAGTYADINELMPRQVQRKCPQAFFNRHDKLTLTAQEIQEFKTKHESMLSGLKNKILRDLLLRK